MTTGQTRVLVLILILAAMEMVLQPAIKFSLQTVWANFNTGLNAGAQPKAGS